MRVLIIGASSFLGGHVLREASASGHEVVTAGRSPVRASAAHHRLDLAADGPSRIAGVISSIAPGAVINCAGPTPTEKLHLPLASAPGGALLAKLHAEAEPVLASPDAEFPIIDRSHLYLGVNGWRCPGKIPAKVHVEHRATEARKP